MSRYKGDQRTVRQIIQQEKLASVLRAPDFPSELLEKTFDEIDKMAKAGDIRARRLRKLLTDKRFDK
ncbi:MAG: hypothetical protein SNJ72_10200 [Fimbriimonadales bacterium]